MGMIIQKVSQEALLALELFRLNPKSQEGKSSIIQHLIEVAMHYNTEAKSINSIVNACLQLLQQTAGISELDCKNAINESCRAGRILKKPDNDYILSEIVKRELVEQLELFQESEKSFNTGLIDSVGRAINTVISPLAEPFLCETVRDSIQEFFYERAIFIYSRLQKGTDILSVINKDAEIDLKLREKLKPFPKIQVGAKIDDVITGITIFLNNLDKSQKHYLGNLHRRVCYFQILNIDPRLQIIQKESLSNTRIYLDTNVVIRYLCDEVKEHQPIYDVLKASMSLGVKLFISPVTLRELKSLVEEALIFGKHAQNSKVSYILQIDPRGFRNPILEGFFRLRNKKPKLNWDAYISPFRDLEQLLLSYNIQLEKECSENIKAEKLYGQVYQELSTLKRDSAQNMIEHDASNIVLIQRLRQKYPGTVLGSSVWLLTLDRSLPIVDEKMQKKYPIAHCYLVEHWGELLVNFQSVGNFIATDDYISYLASQTLSLHIPEDKIDLHVFEILENSEIIYEKVLNMNPEIASTTIRDLQKSRESKDLLERIKNADKDTKTKLEQQLLSRVSSIESKAKTTIEHQVMTEVNRLKKGISDLSRQLQEMELASQKDNDKINTISQKLISTEEYLKSYESMTLLDKLKFIFKK